MVHYVDVILIPFSQTSSAVVPLQLDASGKVKYDILAKMGQRKDKVVHTSLQAMVSKERPTDPELMKPDEEEIEKVGEQGGRGRRGSTLSIGSKISLGGGAFTPFLVH
jgi:hypothetical protein